MEGAMELNEQHEVTKRLEKVIAGSSDRNIFT